MFKTVACVAALVVLSPAGAHAQVSRTAVVGPTVPNTAAPYIGKTCNGAAAQGGPYAEGGIKVRMDFEKENSFHLWVKNPGASTFDDRGTIPAPVTGAAFRFETWNARGVKFKWNAEFTNNWSKITMTADTSLGSRYYADLACAPAQ